MNLKLYTYPEAAELLRVTPACLRGYVSQGKIKCHRIGKGRIVFTEEDIVNAIQENPTGRKKG